jgi:hypothetical protein
MLSTQRSPLAPLKKGGTRLKVPLFSSEAVRQHGDLGGSYDLLLTIELLKHSLRMNQSYYIGVKDAPSMSIGQRI